MFQDMIGAIEFDVTRTMMKAQIHEQERERASQRATTAAPQNIQSQQSANTDDLPKVERNEACPCGSGKKFKNCHGRKSFS